MKTVEGLLAATVMENITPRHGPRQSLSIVKVRGTDGVGVGVTTVVGVTTDVGVTMRVKVTTT